MLDPYAKDRMGPRQAAACQVTDSCPGAGGQAAGRTGESLAGGLSELSHLVLPSQVALGQHQEEYFSGPWPQAVLKQFQEEPAALGKEVEVWNTGLDLPYEELGPSLVEKCDPLRAFPLGPKALPSLSSSEYRSSLAPSSGDRLSPQLCGQGARSCCLTQPQGIRNRWFPLKSAT